jgi:capsular exopolysaccharide synthesis family protein
MHIPKHNGLTLYISDTSYTIKDVIVPSGFHKLLDVIPAGPVPPNPAELLMSNRLDEMVDELREQYDYIIIDSAPVGLVSDTYLLNRLIDNVVYVSRQNFTPKESTELINEIHENKRLKNIGSVLNGVDEDSGYGYGYGINKNKEKK